MTNWVSITAECTREGFVSIAGAPHNIADGESITDERSGLSVTRKGNEYTYNRAA